jgi:hypothetical protein
MLTQYVVVILLTKRIAGRSMALALYEVVTGNHTVSGPAELQPDVSGASTH